MNRQVLPILGGGILRFTVVLLALFTLYDLSVPLSLCFSSTRPILPETLPLCLLSRFEMLIEGLVEGGPPGLLWHFLPAIVASLLVAIAWTWRDRRRQQK